MADLKSSSVATTSYLALVHPQRGTVHLVVVSEHGEPLVRRSMCGRLETTGGHLMAPPQGQTACPQCQNRLAKLNSGGSGIEALRPGLRRVL